MSKTKFCISWSLHSSKGERHKHVNTQAIIQITLGGYMSLKISLDNGESRRDGKGGQETEGSGKVSGKGGGRLK